MPSFRPLSRFRRFRPRLPRGLPSREMIRMAASENCFLGSSSWRRPPCHIIVILFPCCLPNGFGDSSRALPEAIDLRLQALGSSPIIAGEGQLRFQAIDFDFPACPKFDLGARTIGRELRHRIRARRCKRVSEHTNPFPYLNVR